MRPRVARLGVLVVFCAAHVLAGPVVVLPTAPTAVEKSAAAELTDGLRRVTGLDVQMVAEGDAPSDAVRLYVGTTKAATAALGEVEWKSDEICIRPVADGLILTGHPQRGAIYAVDTLLEDHFGVRWWTSTESTYPRAAFSLPNKETRFAPPFRYRETYYRDGFDVDFKVRMKGNFTSRTRFLLTDIRRISKDKGGDYTLHFYPGRKSSYHSFFEVLPPKTYFKDHPEWFSLVDGVRQPKQLCVTNPDVLREYVRRTKELLRGAPDVDFIQVSQNDWQGACACERCKAAAVADGGTPAGPYLAFANAVAEAIEPEFPHVTVDTFAYQFTRKAPTKTRPRHNVIVRLCDYECVFSSPLADRNVRCNANFVADLEDWGRIAPGQLLVWDYITNFHGYFIPHPNLFSIAPNIRLFAESGVTGVYEQGDALSGSGDFAPLRHWLTAKLLWNPAADADALLREFLSGYYGAAAPYLLDYLRLVNGTSAKAGQRVGCNHNNVTPWFSAADGVKAMELFDRASAAARENVEHLRRVRRERLSVEYVFILNWRSWREYCRKSGLKWPLGEDGVRFIEHWYDDCRAFDVRAHCETTDAGLLDQHVRELINKASSK